MTGILSRIPQTFNVFMGTLIFSFVGFGLFATGFNTPALAEGTAELSAQEKQNLVQQGVEQYEQGKFDQARKNLEKAQRVFPENYAVPYYLGLIYLKQDQQIAAIAQWQRYLKMDPDSENALKIRKNLTLLLRKQAREFAKEAVAAEAKVTSRPADAKAVAVTSFKNLGSEKLGPIGKGIAAMIITDLSQVSGLLVVDRIRLHALLEEMALGTSGLVDKQSAPRLGKLLKAKHVTSGSLADLEKENLMVASTVVDSEEMASIGTQEAQGELKNFYDLEKKIACQIVEDLGKSCEAMPPAFSKIHTKSMPALVAYSWGLDYFDAEKYDEARAQFQEALDEDPKFELATLALLATPITAMIAMNREEMIADAATSGPSSNMAGTATMSNAATASVAGQAVGLPPMTAIAGGAAAVAGGLALAGGGGGDSDGGTKNEETLDGDWQGPWADDEGSGVVLFRLTQNSNAVTGTVSVTGSSCISAGDISGTVSGNDVNLTIQSGEENIQIDASVNHSTKTITGSYNYLSSSSEDCQGDSGPVALTLNGGGVVRW